MSFPATAAMLAFVGVLLLSHSAAAVRLATIRDFATGAADACGRDCARPCQRVLDGVSRWFSQMSTSDASRCDTCAVIYYAHDYDVEIDKCPCRALENFRKVATDETLAGSRTCSDCCLDFVMDAIPDAQRCPDPQEMLNSRSSSSATSYKNACGFTVKPPARQSSSEDSAPAPAPEEDISSEGDTASADSSDSSDSSDSGSSKRNPYDYENLESQFDTCKCICKGLPPCRAPKVATDTAAAAGSDLSGFFDTAAFGDAPADDSSAGVGASDPGASDSSASDSSASDAASGADALAAILP